LTDPGRAAWGALLVERSFAESLAGRHPEGRVVPLAHGVDPGDPVLLIVDRRPGPWFTAWWEADRSFAPVVREHIAHKEGKGRDRILRAIREAESGFGGEPVLTGLYWLRVAEFFHTHAVAAFYHPEILGPGDHRTLWLRLLEEETRALERSVAALPAEPARTRLREVRELSRTLGSGLPRPDADTAPRPGGRPSIRTVARPGRPVRGPAPLRGGRAPRDVLLGQGRGDLQHPSAAGRGPAVLRESPPPRDPHGAPVERVRGPVAPHGGPGRGPEGLRERDPVRPRPDPGPGEPPAAGGHGPLVVGGGRPLRGGAERASEDPVGRPWAWRITMDPWIPTGMVRKVPAGDFFRILLEWGPCPFRTS
jgi:hypothetical protein